MNKFLVGLVLAALFAVCISTPINCNNGAWGNGGVTTLSEDQEILLSLDDEEQTLDATDIARGVDCAKKPICSLNCPGGRSEKVDLTNTPLEATYEQICTKKKRENAINNIQSEIQRHIGDIVDQGFQGGDSLCNVHDKAATTTQSANALRLPSCGSNQMVARQTRDLTTIGNLMTQFAQTVQKVCEEGDIANTTPMQVLLELWDLFKKNNAMTSLQRTVATRLDDTARSILTNSVAIYSAKCDCKSLLDASGADQTEWIAKANQICGVVGKKIEADAMAPQPPQQAPQKPPQEQAPPQPAPQVPVEPPPVVVQPPPVVVQPPPVVVQPPPKGGGFKKFGDFNMEQ